MGTLFIKALIAVTMSAGLGVAGAATAQAADSGAELHSTSNVAVEQGDQIDASRVERIVERPLVVWYHDDFWYADAYYGDDD